MTNATELFLCSDLHLECSINFKEKILRFKVLSGGRDGAKDLTCR